MSGVTARVRAGWKKFRELGGVLCGKKWSVRLKRRVYRTCVRTAMIYGSETWTMRKVGECATARRKSYGAYDVWGKAGR